MLTTRTIGEAENALRALLLSALEGTELNYHRWVALKLVGEAKSISRMEMLSELQEALKVEETEADNAIRFLRRRDFLDKADHELTLTANGEALYDRLNHDIRQLVAQIWKGLESQDLVTAHEVLTTISRRASALLET